MHGLSGFKEQPHIEAFAQAFKDKGFTVVSSFDTPIAKIVFFDTREEIGVFTEIMGITKEGEKAVQEMKIGMAQQ